MCVALDDGQTGPISNIEDAYGIVETTRHDMMIVQEIETRYRRFVALE